MVGKTKHITEIRVRYGETDRMGFCYYGNYAQFLEVARVELLRSKGVSYKELEDAGILLPVRNFSIKYIAPAKYDDVLFIETEIVKISFSSFTGTIGSNHVLNACNEMLSLMTFRQESHAPSWFLLIVKN